MKLLLIVGTHLRHRYFANKINSKFNVAGIIYQTREDMIPESPEFLSKEDEINYIRHFKDRDDAEIKWFGDKKYLDGIKLSKEEINTSKAWNYINYIKPDVVITFGCTILKELLEHLPIRTVNIHQGLSPRYRGVATLFWPFYFLEPNHAGATIHYIDKGIDTGEIIHQCVPEINRNDKIHDIACKAVIKATEDMIKLLRMDSWTSEKQKSTGKLFINSDFRPEHLRTIYNQDIIELYLDGEIKPSEPKLIKQF